MIGDPFRSSTEVAPPGPSKNEAISEDRAVGRVEALLAVAAVLRKQVEVMRDVSTRATLHAAARGRYVRDGHALAAWIGDLERTIAMCERHAREATLPERR